MLEGMLATPQVVQKLTKVWFNTTPQLPAKQVFLVTASAQGSHSPAGLQAVNTTLWSPLKTTELSQYCVGISCLKLLTPGQGTEV